MASIAISCGSSAFIRCATRLSGAWKGAHRAGKNEYEPSPGSEALLDSVLGGQLGQGLGSRTISTSVLTADSKASAWLPIVARTKPLRPCVPKPRSDRKSTRLNYNHLCAYLIATSA